MDEWTDLDQAYEEIFGEHPDDRMTPKHDAIGKFIVTAVNLEAVLSIVAGWASNQTYVESERMSVRDQLAAVRDAHPRFDGDLLEGGR